MTTTLYKNHLSKIYTYYFHSIARTTAPEFNVLNPLLLPDRSYHLHKCALTPIAIYTIDFAN